MSKKSPSVAMKESAWRRSAEVTTYNLHPRCRRMVLKYMTRIDFKNTTSVFNKPEGVLLFQYACFKKENNDISIYCLAFWGLIWHPYFGTCSNTIVTQLCHFVAVLLCSPYAWISKFSLTQGVLTKSWCYFSCIVSLEPTLR